MSDNAVVVDAERWLDGAPIEESAVLFVIGLGDGRLLDALDRRGWRGRVIAFEPGASSRLSASPTLSLLTGPDYSGLDLALATIEPDREQPIVVGDPAVLRADRDEAIRIGRLIVRGWFGARANAEARRKYAGPYLANTLRNLPVIAAAADAAALVQSCPGLPALVVAAGPSLDAALADVAVWRDHVVLIAVDTALRPLLAAGIEPDLVVALDPSDANASHLVDLPPCPRTWLVAEGSLDPEAFESFRDRTCVFRVANHHPWPWLAQYGLDRLHLRAWGSVLTTAFDLALQMGCDPIVFTGADLAFTGGQPYARGTTFEEEWRRAEAWGESLESSWAQRVAAWPETFESGVDGTRVRTAPHLCAFRDWIAAEAARVPDRTVVNASAAGILAGRAIQQRSLAGALVGRPSLDVNIGEVVARWRTTHPPPTEAGPPPASEDVRAEWTRTTGVSSRAIDEALRPARAAAEVPMVPRSTAGPTAARDPDAGYLLELARTVTVREHRLTSPAQDLLAELRPLTHGLDARQAVVVIDELGVSAGAQVRQAVNVLLSERPDLWLEYRRFADAASRLTVLRGDAAGQTLPSQDADAAKWDPAHAPVATALVPLVARVLAPRSVIDLGCGAGYWLQAFEAHHVTDTVGVSARTTPLDAIPDPGRRFDVCLCLEVAHHLPPVGQEALVATCVRASDTVVFSSRLPGAPGASAHARPLAYWAALFWRHGFVMDDSLRAQLERHADIPRSVFEVMVTFRRHPLASSADGDVVRERLTDVVLAAAARLDDLYAQKIWWAVAALDRARAADIETPRPEDVAWPVPTARLLAGRDGTRVFRFRTGAARWYVTHPASTLQVFEDGVALPSIVDGVASAGGGWSRWRDELRLWSSDGSDPRTNGRRYSLRLPAHVARAESQRLQDALDADR